MLDGVSAVAKPPGRWTDEKLALALTEAAGRKHEFAPNTVGGWRKGTSLPDSIGPLLAVVFGDSDDRVAERQSFEDLFKEAQQEKWGPLKKKATNSVGPVFIDRGRAHPIDRAPRETDSRVARKEQQQNLQANVLRSAERLAANVESRGARYSNIPSWRDLAVHARQLADIAALDPKSLVRKLQDAYGVSLFLGGRLNIDDRIGAGRCEEPPLDVDVRGDLAHLVRLTVPWLRGFPTVRKLDDDATRGLTDFGDRTPAREVIEAAAKAAAITIEDAETMRTLDDAADDPDFLGKKARRRFVGGAGNLALSLAKTESERQADALDLSDPDTRARAEATRATLIQAGADIDRLPLPEDVRAAFRSLVAEAVRRPAIDLAPPPEDVEARARALILDGIAPPKAWRPWIKTLDFANSDFADATPLAGLTSLISLDLRGTQMADATPLAGLTALTWLALGGTRIADVTPLAGLTSLTWLSLEYTKIADVTPLAGLTALTSLGLLGTPIADATPLGGLTSLTSLYLDGTRITNARPLAGLTSLTSLGLRGTKIADARPLAGLTALTSLDLGGTRIADAAPLAGLTALTWLNLMGTPIADATPLAGLMALTSLDLRATQIADLAPLAGLIAQGLEVVCYEPLRAQYEALRGQSPPG